MIKQTSTTDDKLMNWYFLHSYVNAILYIVDVDVPEPDEKSLITYVSSLYDVFPEVPSVEQSLQDNVSTYHQFARIKVFYLSKLLFWDVTFMGTK